MIRRMIGRYAPISFLLFVALATGCSQPSEKPGPTPAEGRKIRLGFSMDTLKEERWHRDRDLLVKSAGELGAEVLVQAANGNDALQNSQAENNGASSWRGLWRKNRRSSCWMSPPRTWICGIRRNYWHSFNALLSVMVLPWWSRCMT